MSPEKQGVRPSRDPSHTHNAASVLTDLTDQSNDGGLEVRDRFTKGPVRLLCDEIGFRFDQALERQDVYVAFVRELVREIEQMRDTELLLASVTAKPPSNASGRVLLRALAMLDAPDAQALRTAAQDVHDLSDKLNPDEKVPTDHIIDMLSSCASAIRFGLDDRGFGSSRHAASAAQHVWKRRYGVSLFDSNTPSWEKEWARGKLLDAIVSLLPAENKPLGSEPSYEEDGQHKTNLNTVLGSEQDDEDGGGET